MQETQPWLGEGGCRRFYIAKTRIPGAGCQDGFGSKDPGAKDLGRGESWLVRPNLDLEEGRAG